MTKTSSSKKKQRSGAQKRIDKQRLMLQKVGSEKSQSCLQKFYRVKTNELSSNETFCETNVVQKDDHETATVTSSTSAVEAHLKETFSETNVVPTLNHDEPAIISPSISAVEAQLEETFSETVLVNEDESEIICSSNSASYEQTNETSHPISSTEVESEVVTTFAIPKKDSQSIYKFLQLHPIQPKSCEISSLFTRFCGGKIIPRNWLSYNLDNGALYCSVCMVFSETKSQFRTGAKFDKKHVSTRIKEHESSENHILSAQAYVRHDTSKSIDDIIDQARLNNVRSNQELVKRLINWILCIGRQGIAYRGQSESTKYFNDKSVNHGNLLEILMTASQHF